MSRLLLEMDLRGAANPQPDFSSPGLVVWMNAGEDSQFPSRNPNKVELHPDSGPVDEKAIREVAERFRAAGAKRFFFWIDQSWPEVPVDDWLQQAGLQPFWGTTYPVLLREAAAIPSPPTDFRIERLDAAGSRRVAGCYGEGVRRDRFSATIGLPGFEHFVAWDGDKPVASARLFIHDGLAYLNDAGTLEEYRGRGAQSALIAARVNRAAELGCSHCFVYTLRFLETSLGNLMRCGFKEVWEWGVWEWKNEG